MLDIYIWIPGKYHNELCALCYSLINYNETNSVVFVSAFEPYNLFLPWHTATSLTTIIMDTS